MYRLIALMATILFSLPTLSLAGEVQGQVTTIKVDPKKSRVKFQITSYEKADACDSTGWFGFDTNRAGGMLSFQVLIDAYTTQKRIKVIAPDADACAEEAGTVTVNALVLGTEKPADPVYSENPRKGKK